MSRLHVCIDLIVMSFGKVMEIGLLAIFRLTAGTPSTRKWQVAPESEITYFIACVILCQSKIVSALGNLLRLFACIACHHVCRLVAGRDERWVGLCVGMSDGHTG